VSRELSPDELIELYRQMVLIRRLEEKSAELYTEGKIGGFLHLYIGEEAIATGACKALRPEDHLITAYRDHGWAIARGLDPGRVMAELLGKATGVSGGKGGSMHLASAAHRFWGGHAIVGGHLPLAAGIGLAYGRLEAANEWQDRALAGHAAIEGARRGGRERRKALVAIEGRIACWRAELAARLRPDGRPTRGAISEVARKLAKAFGTTPARERRFYYERETAILNP